MVVLNWSCKESCKQPTIYEDKIETKASVDNETSFDRTVKSVISTPADFFRSDEELNSFQDYLRNLKLKPKGSLVRYYNGSTKTNSNIYEAVVDLEIGNKNLHQCADAVMRLRAEYLWGQKRYKDIYFNFTNGHTVEYSEYMNGKRMNIEGNRTWWSDKKSPSNTYDDFWNYMELIFTYAGTASLEKELAPINISEAQIGDVLIQGGHPGHAVIIIDKAIHKNTGSSIFLLAQSYMPAQEIQILKNPMNAQLSPWYEFKEGDIATPEWGFNSNNLKRFK